MTRRDLVANEDGSIAVLLALFLSVSVGVCALAVDVGSLYLERRTVQSAADLAAMAAASDLDRADAAAMATLSANGFGAVRSYALVKGRYEADPALSPQARFSAGQEPFNAVRLDVALDGRLHFAKSFLPEPEISVSAIARADALATFSIGSRLAAVRGGLANAVLSGLLGSSVSLSVMDYEALLDADISLLPFLSALATELGVTAGTYGDVLASEVSVGTVLEAAAHVADSSGEGTAASVLARLAQESGGATVPLSALVDLGPISDLSVGDLQSGLGAQLNVMSLVSAAASLANGSSQVSLNLAGTIPGLLSLTADVAIGEPAQHSGWVTVGQAGAKLRTAQTRLRVVAEVGGTGLLAGVRVRLPLYIELASAEAELKSLACQSPGSGSALVKATPAVVRAWIGDVSGAGLSSFGSPVPVAAGRLVDAPLVKVSASAFAEMSNIDATDLAFSQADVDGRVVKTAEVQDYASSLVATLLASANVDVNILGLGIGLGSGPIKTLVASLLTPVAAQLDNLLRPLLELLGVHLGEVDVQVNGIRCKGAVLAG